MKGLLFGGNRTVELKEFAKPSPGFRQVVVKVMVSGVCGSDLHHLFQSPPEARARHFITGHEGCGVVEAVGDGVRHLHEGDRVMVAFQFGCGYCDACRSGWPSHCERRDIKRSYGWSTHGSNADYLLADALNCVPMPDGLSYEAGAYCVCGAGTAYTAIKRTQPNALDTVAVFGLGPVGLAGALAARFFGAQTIGVDLIPARLELASKLGIGTVVNAAEADPVEAIRKQTGGKGASITADFSGAERGRAQALQAAAAWGRVVLVGEGGVLNVDPSPTIIWKQLAVYGSHLSSMQELGELAGLAASGRIPLDKAVTHRFTLEEAAEAFRVFEEGSTGKVVFVLER
ncbi:MAG: alcohol dehydrogenase catalytic domain-containing protein [Chloroflexota bacterium]